MKAAAGARGSSALPQRARMYPLSKLWKKLPDVPAELPMFLHMTSAGMYLCAGERRPLVEAGLTGVAFAVQLAPRSAQLLDALQKSGAVRNVEKLFPVDRAQVGSFLRRGVAQQAKDLGQCLLQLPVHAVRGGLAAWQAACRMVANYPVLAGASLPLLAALAYNTVGGPQ